MVFSALRWPVRAGCLSALVARPPAGGVFVEEDDLAFEDAVVGHGVVRGVVGAVRAPAGIPVTGVDDGFFDVTLIDRDDLGGCRWYIDDTVVIDTASTEIYTSDDAGLTWTVDKAFSRGVSYLGFVGDTPYAATWDD